MQNAIFANTKHERAKKWKKFPLVPNGAMAQQYFTVPVVWLIRIQLCLMLKLSTKSCDIDAFTVQHASKVHQFYVKSKQKHQAGLTCPRCCRYVSSGVNEPPFNISSSCHDEDILPSVETISENFPDTGNRAPNTAIRPRSVRGITLKMALDRNGGVACRSEIRPERFTGSESLDMVHRLRSHSDAVLIGVGTAIVDDPSLLVRRNVIVDQQPLRVVIDPMLRLVASSTLSSQQNNSYQLLTDGYPLVMYHCRNDTTTNPILVNITKALPTTVQLHYVKPISVGSSMGAARINVKIIFDHLQTHYNVQHLMVEGGPRTAQLFLQSNLIDRCILVQAPIQFDDPVLSNITPLVLQSANLIPLGSIPSGADIIECWSRPNLPWPTFDLRDWP